MLLAKIVSNLKVSCAVGFFVVWGLEFISHILLGAALAKFLVVRHKIGVAIDLHSFSPLLNGCHYVSIHYSMVVITYQRLNIS